MTIEELKAEWEDLFSKKADKGFDLCRGVDWMQKFGPKLLDVAEAAEKITWCNDDQLEKLLPGLISAVAKLQMEIRPGGEK